MLLAVRWPDTRQAHRTPPAGLLGGGRGRERRRDVLVWGKDRSGRRALGVRPAGRARRCV